MKWHTLIQPICVIIFIVLACWIFLSGVWSLLVSIIFDNATSIGILYGIIATPFLIVNYINKSQPQDVDVKNLERRVVVFLKEVIWPIIEFSGGVVTALTVLGIVILNKLPTEILPESYQLFIAAAMLVILVFVVFHTMEVISKSIEYWKGVKITEANQVAATDIRKLQ